ncbi:MAG: DUF6198 family protein [Clostridiales bacterium]|nr:DUF6198 family protein [Clostridiales bacterium]
MCTKRNILFYIAGLFVMAFGIVLIKKAGVGVSPVSAIPSVLADLLPLSFGNTTILFQVVCFILIFVVRKKADVKTFLILPVAIAFGYIIDLYMFLLPSGNLPIWLSYVVCLAGIAATAMGITLIVRADLMLPSPDALIRAISDRYSQPLSRIKMEGDGIYVAIALALELIFFHHPESVWIGTALSVLLTGRLVGAFTKYLSRNQTEPG